MLRACQLYFFLKFASFCLFVWIDQAVSSQEHLPSRCLSTLASKPLQRSHHGSVWGAYFNALNKFLFLYRSFAYEIHGIQFPLLVSTGNQQEELSRCSCRSQFLKKTWLNWKKRLLCSLLVAIVAMVEQRIWTTSGWNYEVDCIW